jgi:hypothetical protein
MRTIFYLEKEYEPENKKLRVFLEANYNGWEDKKYITLYAEAPDGNTWEILHLTEEGKLFLCNNLPDNIGLKITELGKIQLASG